MALEAIFYRRLMPTSVGPTTLKNSDFGRAKKTSSASAAVVNPAVQKGSGLSCTRRYTGKEM